MHYALTLALLLATTYPKDCCTRIKVTVFDRKDKLGHRPSPKSVYKFTCPKRQAKLVTNRAFDLNRLVIRPYTCTNVAGLNDLNSLMVKKNNLLRVGCRFIARCNMGHKLFIIIIFFANVPDILCLAMICRPNRTHFYNLLLLHCN